MMKMKVLTVETIVVLLLTAGIQTTLYTQFAFASVVSGIGNNNNVGQPGYSLTVNVPSHPFGTSTVGISITTENGYTNQANVPTAGNPSWTFNIPPNQGNSVQVCVNSGALSQENCHTYKTTGTDMSVSLPAISGTSNSGGTSNHKSSNNSGGTSNHKSSNNSGGTSNHKSSNNSRTGHHDTNHGFGGFFGQHSDGNQQFGGFKAPIVK
jgi:hypothetical protein